MTIRDDKFKMIWRIGQAVWASGAARSFFGRYPDIADEFWLFVGEESGFGYLTEDKLSVQLDSFKKAKAELEAAGLANIGINPWPTIAAPCGNSHDATEACETRDAREVLESFKALGLDPMIGYDGTASANQPCPRSEAFLKFVRRQWKSFAQAGASLTWVDDDCRLTHLGGDVAYPCFCAKCVAGFEGGAYDGREALAAALNKPENLELREKWCHYVAQALAGVCAEARAGVDEVDPSIDIGFMTVGTTHTSYGADFIKLCMDALRSERGRPGHGFYEDEKPRGLLEKALVSGRQVRQYPARVRTVLYEEESHPGVTLNKAYTTRINEIYASLATGCNGVAFNHLPNTGDLADYSREMEAYRLHRPVWEEYTRFAAQLPLKGVWTAENDYIFQRMKLAYSWFNEGDPRYDVTKPDEMLSLGIPFAVEAGHAAAVILCGDLPYIFTDAELREILSKPVIADIGALAALNSRGFAGWAGAVPAAGHHSTFERLSDHALNAGYAGYKRFILYERCHELVPLSRETEALAWAEDVYGNRYEHPCMTLYRNDAGGSVLALGATHWRQLGYRHKIDTLKNYLDIMTNGNMPLVVEDFVRVAPFVRTDGAKAAVTLINNMLDPTGAFTIRIGGRAQAAYTILPGGARRALDCRRVSNGLRVHVDSLAPWEARAVFAM